MGNKWTNEMTVVLECNRTLTSEELAKELGVAVDKVDAARTLFDLPQIMGVIKDKELSQSVRFHRMFGLDSLSRVTGLSKEDLKRHADVYDYEIKFDQDAIDWFLLRSVPAFAKANPTAGADGNNPFARRGPGRPRKNLQD